MNKTDAIGETFIITDGLEINWKTYISKICRQLQIPAPRRSVSFETAFQLALWLGSVYSFFKISNPPPITRYRVCNFGRDYHFSIDKAKHVLGYVPAIGIDQAVRRTVAWYHESKRSNLNDNSTG